MPSNGAAFEPQNVEVGVSLWTTRCCRGGQVASPADARPRVPISSPCAPAHGRAWNIARRRAGRPRVGRVIESYPEDRPYPSRLILGYADDRPLHVVAAEAEDLNRTIIVTVYEPDPALWEPEFRQRRKP